MLRDSLQTLPKELLLYPESNASTRITEQPHANYAEDRLAADSKPQLVALKLQELWVSLVPAYAGE